MASRLLLFATPIAVLLAVMQVPANSAVDFTNEIELAPVPMNAVSEAGDFISNAVQIGNGVQLVEHQSESTSPQQLETNVVDISFKSPVASQLLNRSFELDTPPVGKEPLAFSVPGRQIASTANADIAKLRVLSERYWREPNSRHSIESELFRIAQKIYFENDQHYVPPHVVRRGEILTEIAATYRVPWEYVADLNKISPTQLRVGAAIKVTPGPFSAIVERSRHRLTVHAHGYVVAAFDVGLGVPTATDETSTPTGTFTIADRVTNPTWYGPNGVVPGDDPSNPLGEYWLGLADSGGNPTTLGIHGTLAPHTIGQNASNGCVRLRNDDIRQLFRLLAIGSIVEIRD